MNNRLYFKALEKISDALDMIILSAFFFAVGYLFGALKTNEVWESTIDNLKKQESELSKSDTLTEQPSPTLNTTERESKSRGAVNYPKP